MTSIRQWHSYMGLFIAPSVLFFALTGALQVFSLHEAHGHYRPLPVIEKLSSVHKDQVYVLAQHHEDAAPAPDAKDGADDDDKTAVTTYLLKGFFLVVALCLTVSTLLGIWMGLTQGRRNLWNRWLLIAGAVIPVALLAV